jgi:hypothetical protein
MTSLPDLLHVLLPYAATIAFTIIATFSRPNGSLMLVNVVLIPIALLLLLFNASIFSRPDGRVDMALGGTFDYRLFVSVKWWIFIVPIAIMAIRMPLCFYRGKSDSRCDVDVTNQ